MQERLQRLTAGFRCNHGIARSVVTETMELLSVRPPDDYVEFMAICDGGDGHVGTSLLDLWPVGQVPQLNRDYQVQRFAPGLVVFGSDGGGVAYAFDARQTPASIVSVEFGNVDLAEVRPLGDTFTAFMEWLYRQP
jgi:hypothetical protein